MRRDILTSYTKGNLTITMILVINAVSTLLATVGIGGLLARENRRARRNAIVQPLYVTTKTTRTLPHR